MNAALKSVTNKILGHKTHHQYLSEEQLNAFGAEIEALRAKYLAKLGQEDVDYIKGIIRLQKRLEIGGRAAIYAGIFNPLVWVGGVATLGVAKILDNMEIGHNMMHGQFDWTNDPEMSGRKFEWDNACPGDQWRHSHNYMHHTFTNIIGKDRDVGYGVLRMAEDQKWEPKHLVQSIYAFWLMVFFEWGVAFHDLETDRIRKGEVSWKEKLPMLKQVLKKGGRQILKDYIAYPLLAGPFFLPVLAGNFIANIIRNVWSFVIIFCGHFTEDVAMFKESDCENETKAEWYLRQLLGSSNIEGGKWMHIMSGNLSHQIEHHLFPDIPAHRYAAMAEEMRVICTKYNLPYNTGSLAHQFSTVVQRIFKLSLPNANPENLQNPVMN